MAPPSPSRTNVLASPVSVNIRRVGTGYRGSVPGLVTAAPASSRYSTAARISVAFHAGPPDPDNRRDRRLIRAIPLAQGEEPHRGLDGWKHLVSTAADVTIVHLHWQLCGRHPGRGPGSGIVSGGVTQHGHAERSRTRSVSPCPGPRESVREARAGLARCAGPTVAPFRAGQSAPGVWRYRQDYRGAGSGAVTSSRSPKVPLPWAPRRSGRADARRCRDARAGQGRAGRRVEQVAQCRGRAGESAPDAPEIIYCTAVAEPVGLPEPAAGRADAKATRQGRPTAARKR